MLARVHQTDWTRADAIASKVLRDNGGIARIDEFLAAGLTRHQIAAIHRRGLLDRPRNAWYVDPALPWQAKHAVRVGGLLACTSAAASYGVPVPPGAGGRIHVRLPGNAPRVRHHRDKRHYVVPGEDTEVVTHWAPEDGTPPGWRTSLPSSLLLLADCVPVDWWIAALDAARHEPRDAAPLMTAEEFSDFSARVPLRLRPALRRVNPLAGSCIETLLRLGMERREIGPIVLQFAPRKHRSVDFLLPGKVIVEADGEQFHDPEQDAIRDAYFRGLGYVVLRFSYRRIVYDLENVLDEIEAVLNAR